MNLSPYLNFNGSCKEAFTLYAAALNGKITMMMTFGESPMSDHVPKDQQHLVVHASLDLGQGHLILGSDAPPERYQAPQGMMVSYSVATVDEAKRVFTALADGAQILMPIGPTFWSAQFGMLTDRFGIPWMINCEQMPA
jgi:PhnB protein